LLSRFRFEGSVAKADAVFAMRGELLADTRNIFLPTEADAAGFRYLGIGRGSESVKRAQVNGASLHVSASP
jgi:hypothetical protein